MKKVCNILTVLLLAVLVAVAGALLAPRALGYQSYAVQSGSMEPAYHVGSVVLVKKAEPDQIKAGDAITFRLPGGQNMVTHRVVEVNAEAKAFITKGDANPENDPDPVAFSQLVGRAEHSIPLVGYVALYIKTPAGIAVAAAVALTLLILLFLPDVLKKKEN